MSSDFVPSWRSKAAAAFAIVALFLMSANLGANGAEATPLTFSQLALAVTAAVAGAIVLLPLRPTWRQRAGEVDDGIVIDLRTPAPSSSVDFAVDRRSGAVR